MQVTYFFRNPSPAYHSIEKLFGAIIEKMPPGSATSHFAKRESKGFFNRILIGLEARRNQGNINHITGDIHFVALFLKKRKTILTIHDIGIIKTGNILKRLVIKFFWFYLPIRAVNKVTVISDFTKNELISSIKVRPERILVIPNCFPAAFIFKEKSIVNEKPVILQIGTKKNKNLERLIEALYEISCKLLIVGKLSEHQIALLDKYEIDYENFIDVREPEMVDLYRRADILAYISTYEGFGMPVVEANAVGLPVLASDIEPIKSVASDAALLVSPIELSDIRTGILKLIEDKELREKLISNGFENAQKYHPQKIVNDYIEVYKSLI